MGVLPSYSRRKLVSGNQERVTKTPLRKVSPSPSLKLYGKKGHRDSGSS